MQAKPAAKKVVVALSGGVDSSVAAALLHRQGVEVIGVTMRLWSEPGCEQENRCCTPETRLLAQRLCHHLGIPFHVLDASEVFRSHVVQAFLDGYAAGSTPNPCIACNQFIKWGYLHTFAGTLSADTIATGHYARLITAPDGKIELWKGVDAGKDQSYFLSTLSQSQLKSTLFPLGEYTKEQVRKMAHEWGLPAADLPESQDLCFLGHGDYRTFLRKYAPEVVAPGKVIDRGGIVVGEHEGLAFYTIGQRKGLPASTHAMYVLAKHVSSNTLVVGPAEALGSKQLFTGQVSWISGDPPSKPLSVQVKIRYKAAPADAVLTPLAEGGARVHLDKPLRDITPGQMAVFYQGEKLLGGGVIRQ